MCSNTKGIYPKVAENEHDLAALNYSKFILITPYCFNV